MDSSANPLDDFHTYSSGNYGSSGNGVNRNYRLHVATQEKIIPKFLAVFQKLKNSSYESGSLEEKVFRFYNLCEKDARISITDVQPDVNLSWPFNTTEGSQWPKEQFQWLRTLAHLRRYGMKNAIFRMNLKWDAENSLYRVVIKKPKFATHSDYVDLEKEDLIKIGYRDTRAESLEHDIESLQKDIRDLVIEAEATIPQTLSLIELESKLGVLLSSYFEIVFGHPLPLSFQVEVDDMDYLIKIVKLINRKDPEVVATYLLDRFVMFIKSSSRLEGLWNPKGICIQILRTSMEFASNLLFEENILGAQKLKVFQTEMDRLFAAVQKQFNFRLDRSSSNLSFTSSLRKKLSFITINIGNMPKDQDHRRFATEYYSDLHFNNDTEFATIHLKALELRERNLLMRLNKPTLAYPYPEDPERLFEVGSVENGNVIIVPYNILVEPFFMIHSDDVFKMSTQGYLLASLVEKALFPEEVRAHNCQKYDQFLAIFDDQKLLKNRSSCNYDDYFKISKELVLLNLVYEAFFSEGSGFSHSQPTFTNMSLEQLFFLSFSQNIFGNDDWWKHDSIIYNPLLQLTSFTRAFNSSKLA
nr:neprilysin-21-like [Drosophila bipectinata]